MTTHDEDHGSPSPRLRDSRTFEILIGAGVLLISIVSIFIAVSANRTQERMLAASVWPSPLFGTSNAALDGTPQITFDLLNRGVGPARFRWAEVLYDGKPVNSAGALLALCCGHEPTREDEPLVFTSGIQHRVVGADEWVVLLRMPRTDPPAPLYTALENALPKIRFRACYCSVLDECWLLDSSRDDPEQVRQCPQEPEVLWGRRLKKTG